MQAIDGWVRNLIQPPLALSSPDYKSLLSLRTQYLRRLEPFVATDKSAYDRAVREITGWSSAEYSVKYGAFWERYEDAKVTPAWAAKDLRVTEKRFLDCLAHELKLKGAIDPVLGSFLLKGDRRRPVGIRQWEEAYPLAVVLLKGAK